MAWSLTSREARAAERDVIKAGGVRVPMDSIKVIKKIIEDAFNAMETKLHDHNIVVKPLLLEEIESFEEEVLGYIVSILFKLEAETKDYGVLTRDAAQDRMKSELKTMFLFVWASVDSISDRSDKDLEVVLNRVHRDIFMKTHLYINKWKYYY